MMTLYTATRRHVIKINFMYIIIQCEIISCNKFLEKQNILTMKKAGRMIDLLTVDSAILSYL